MPPLQPKFTVNRYTAAGRTVYRVVIPARFSSTGKRQSVYYPTAAAAEADARKLRAMHAGGTIGLLSMLTPAQVKDAAAALETLNAAGLHITLAEAAAVAARHSAAVRHGATIAELLARYETEAGQARGWKTATRASWRKYARPMADAIGSTPCADLTTEALLEFMRAAFPTAPLFNGARRTLSGAFAWAVKQRMAAENPFSRVDAIAVESKEIDVFTPAEARALLDACTGELAPCRTAFAVSLFAGVRPKELARLTWEDVRVEADGRMFIFISARAAKTSTARFIRVRPNLRAFLESTPPAERTGKLTPPGWERKQKAARRAAGLAGRQDTARHSFASYALAAGEPLHDVMRDMGHAQSSTVIFTHYRAAATPSAAREYWAILP